MVPLKPEETLHNYLRRHFEKISKGKARQFAEQRDIPEVNVVPDTRSSDGSWQPPRSGSSVPCARVKKF
jgi:hypothetical protein